MVTIYSTKTCGFCRAVKQYLDGLKVPYEVVMVDEVPNGAELLLEKSGQLGVPVIDFGKEVVIGFNRPQIDLLLRENKLV
jgi:glutaredoxin 3